VAEEINYLVLDLGGVLVHDPMNEFFAEADRLSSRSRREIINFYQTELRHPLWSGALEEDSFWSEFLIYTDIDDGSYLREYIQESLRLLPAVARMKEIEEIAPLFALSNHRHEWIRPVLAEHDLDKCFEKVFISSEIGVVKPDPESIEYVLEALGAAPDEVLFVDDKLRNLKTAEGLGVKTILADPDGDWIDQLI